MCAWKRGTQNNAPGQIRKGQIREYQVRPKDDPSRVHEKLLIFDNNESFPSIAKNTAYAYICTPDQGLPLSFCNYIYNNMIYIHAHEYPNTIITAVIDERVPYRSIVLSSSHRINSKVCTGEDQEWTIFQGEQISYDGREGAIGATSIKSLSGIPPMSIHNILLEIKLYETNNNNFKHDKSITYENGNNLRNAFRKLFYNCILVIGDVYVYEYNNHKYVARIVELFPETNVNQLEDETDESFMIDDFHMGLMDEFSEVYLIVDDNYTQNNDNNNPSIVLLDNPCLNSTKQNLNNNKNIVEIITNDEEVFPVKKRLLRSCISLTSVVHAGKGKYKTDNNNKVENDNINVSLAVQVDVDACTFDRVLLYLEHEAREEKFNFDPLLANELLEASKTLGIIGLQEACEKVLGSFQERVRKTPIRLQEIMIRNSVGGITIQGKKRSDTLLIMSGMVFDITRWLDEHPGGSTIIPEQALGVDCTVFFEIYHASRQSFLYLKEFYIGELAIEDRDNVPLPANNNSNNGGKASEAFMEQLRNITSWRLDITKLSSYENHKSF
eukprot:gene9354-12604_t